MVRSVAYLFHLTVSLCTSVCISFVPMLYLYGSMCTYLRVCVDLCFLAHVRDAILFTSAAVSTVLSLSIAVSLWLISLPLFLIDNCYIVFT